MISSIVLAGGKSLRLGRDKAKEDLGGQSLIQRVVSCVATLSSEILVVTAPGHAVPSICSPTPWRVALDLYPGRGSLGGIYSGLKYSHSFHSLAVGCDMPFLNPGLLRYMVNLCPDFDVVIPRIGGGVEPLHAIYSKNCLGPIEALLQQGNLQIFAFFPSVRTRYVEEDEVDRYDARHLSFFNVNTEDDLNQAKALLQEQEVEAYPKGSDR